jgi:hypothetical protein
MTHLRKSQYFNVIAMMLLAVMTLMNGNIKRLPLAAVRSAVNQVVMVKAPCSQSKSSQSLARSLCQAKVELKSILSSFVLFLTTITGKLYFLFVTGLLAASHRRRIYKPPRLVLS